MEELIEFRKPDGSTYFAKFPESEADTLVLPAIVFLQQKEAWARWAIL